MDNERDASDSELNHEQFHPQKPDPFRSAYEARAEQEEMSEKKKKSINHYVKKVIACCLLVIV